MSLSIYPDPIIVPNDGAIALFAYSDNTSAGTEASWSVADETVVTVTQHTIDGEAPEMLGGVIMHGESVGTTTVTVTVTESGHEAEGTSVTEDVEVKSVNDIEIEEFDDLKIYDVDRAHIGTIPNKGIIDLNINRKLSGDYSIDFTVPADLDEAAQLKRGNYFYAEGSHFFIDKIRSRRGNDGNPLIDVTCLHEYFDNLHIPTLWRSDAYSEIIDQLRRALYQRGIRFMVITGLDTDDDYFKIKRYVEIRPEDSRLRTVQKIFQTFGGDFRLWGSHLIVLPYKEAMPESNLKMHYALNNMSINRNESDSAAITTLQAQGGTVEVGGEKERLEVIVEASEQIKAHYRYPRLKPMDFGDVTDETELTYMANQYMTMLERTRASYDLDVVELKRLSAPPSGEWAIDVGKVVHVKDDDLGIDVDQYILGYRYKPLEPENPAKVTVGGKIYKMRMFTRPDDPEIVEHGAKPAQQMVGESGDDDHESRMPLHGFISSGEPDDSRGKENDLWIQYEV